MKKRGKKYLEALNKIEKGKAYTKEEAVKLAKETSVSNFDASVEVAVRLNLDTKKADQQLRGAIVLPNGTGKTKKVLVVARGENAKKAKEAGADFVKTSTGFSTGGAKVEDIRLMRETVGPDMGVKASGGVRDFEKAQAMIEAGATRIGTSSAAGIVE